MALGRMNDEIDSRPGTVHTVAYSRWSPTITTLVPSPARVLVACRMMLVLVLGLSVMSLPARRH